MFRQESRLLSCQDVVLGSLVPRPSLSSSPAPPVRREELGPILIAMRALCDQLGVKAAAKRVAIANTSAVQLPRRQPKIQDRLELGRRVADYKRSMARGDCLSGFVQEELDVPRIDRARFKYEQNRCRLHLRCEHPGFHR